jgi:signal transduction histidine kinase
VPGLDDTQVTVRIPATRTRGRSAADVGMAALRLVVLVCYVAVVYGLIVYLVEAVWPDSPGALRAVLLLSAATVCAVTLRPVDQLVRRALGHLRGAPQATPYDTLTALSGQLASARTVDDALPALARMLAEGTGSAQAEAWLLVADRFVLTAAWPDRAVTSEPAVAGFADLAGRPDIDYATLVADGDGTLGALAIGKRDGDFLTPVDVQLVNDIRHSAALLMRNAQLGARLAERIHEMADQETQLRASRRRIVNARDIARQRLVDEITSTVRHNLSRMRAQLPAMRGALAADGEDVPAMLARMQAEATQLIEHFRSIVHGVYPPVLRDHGLAAALDGLAATLPRTVHVRSAGVGRYSPDIEATMYFVATTLARLRATGAGDAALQLRCWTEEQELHLSLVDRVADDIPTFPAEALADVQDRLAALGGALHIRHRDGVLMRAYVPLDGTPR